MAKILQFDRENRRNTMKVRYNRLKGILFLSIAYNILATLFMFAYLVSGKQ